MLRYRVAIDFEPGPWQGELELAAGATVADALAAAQRLAHGQPGAGSFDWQGAATGIWGRPCARSTRLQAGDRVEAYRPLAADPRERRRKQAGVTRGPLKRPVS
jgi:putative ubiquitin-RnfH superfamily antitoxin RatB of RatAB toxin-antitoxin module